MALYWELAVCYGSLMAILVFTMAVAKGHLHKSDPTVKYIKLAFSFLAVASVVSMLFTI